MAITIKTPKEFSFEACYRFLDRSDKECLHTLRDGKVYKLLSIEDAIVLIEVENLVDSIRVNCLNKKLNSHEEKEVIAYMNEWWNLNKDLKPLYRFCGKDSMLKKLSKDHFGLRMIGFPDLFECLIWAIIGQQINLNFAYIIKQRFVEKYGTIFEQNGHQYFHFPDAKSVSEISIEALKELKFSRQKANYTLNVANAILKDNLNKKELKLMGYEAAKTSLKKIKGVGDWTADYALMKCIGYPNAIPIGDVGLQNALKAQLKMDTKPTKEALIKFAKQWGNHSGYICFYLWSSLLKEN